MGARLSRVERTASSLRSRAANVRLCRPRSQARAPAGRSRVARRLRARRDVRARRRKALDAHQGRASGRQRAAPARRRSSARRRPGQRERRRDRVPAARSRWCVSGTRRFRHLARRTGTRMSARARRGAAPPRFRPSPRGRGCHANESSLPGEGCLSGELRSCRRRLPRSAAPALGRYRQTHESPGRERIPTRALGRRVRL